MQSNRNHSEDEALTIVALIAAIYVLVGLIGIVALFVGGREMMSQTAHWKRFDDAHYWDETAEDWRPHEHLAVASQAR
ncbi:hypothetical protein RPB_4483 [Rhodopseudomonas palustris HaA2]|uniref:Uncharacterized protein n=1 Tax=Rhodopseudomonas palustris (strain HaA2) TaxID=316058 RepID=Q2IRJ4_RHOP2|nr:hypothetical protein RPB_4483 [Rhodopseudomonas palustris HaA2]